jgi:hypothetical protein
MASQKVTVEQIQQAFEVNRECRGSQVVLVSAGRTSLAWLWGKRRYEIRSLGKILHKGADVEAAVEAYNEAVA